MSRRKFIIPTNFMETGYLMDGAIPVRNVVEAGVLALVGFFIAKSLPMPEGSDWALTPYILIMAPLAMFGLYGVQGDPLSVFVLDFFKWRKRRRPYFYNAHSEAYTKEAADMLMDAPQLRDLLADAFDSLRKKLAPADVSYVEGETFQFASDPEQEALREAQDELRAKREEETAKLLEELQKQVEAEEAVEAVESVSYVPPASSTGVDAQKIAEMLVLDDIVLDGEEET